MRYEYKTKMTCPSKIAIEYNKNIITNIEFNGGCPGNLSALKKIIIGMTFEEVIELFSGNLCGIRGTSCMDQLAVACKQLLEKDLMEV